jgi:hypothetical protein
MNDNLNKGDMKTTSPALNKPEAEAYFRRTVEKKYN